VDEDLQAHNPVEFRAMTEAGDALEAAVAAYFGASPHRRSRRAAPPAPAAHRHIADARQLTRRAAQRAHWVAKRQADLNQVYQRITSAGGSGLAINGTEVVARRSLAELERLQRRARRHRHAHRDCTARA